MPVAIARQSSTCTFGWQWKLPALQSLRCYRLHVLYLYGTLTNMSNPEQQQAPDPGPWTLGERLAKARKGSVDGKLSQEKLADRLALVRATIGRYEAGNIPEDELKRTVVAWAMATGWRYEWIMTGTGPWLRDGSSGPDKGSDVDLNGFLWNVARLADQPLKRTA